MTPFRSISTALGLGLLALGGVVPAAAQPRPDATCERDLFQNEAGMRREQTRMEAASRGDATAQCSAWREHVSYLQKARGVFTRCQSGRQRQDNVAMIDQSLAEFRVLLADRCGRR